MWKVALSIGIGMAAAVLLAVSYLGARYVGVHIDPPSLIVIAAGLAFASSVAAFMLVALNRPLPGKIHVYPLLTELDSQNFIGKFWEDGAVQIVFRPGMTADMAFARFRDTTKLQDKTITLVLRAARKEMFNPVLLEELFKELSPQSRFYHVLLMNEANEFVGYIPAASARKEFVSKNAESKITEYIIDVLNDPKSSKKLRAIGGASQDDTIPETSDARDAAKKMWLADDPSKLRDSDDVSGLVVSRHLRPYGFLDRLSLIKLTATLS